MYAHAPEHMPVECSFYIFAPYATDTQTDKHMKIRHSHELYNRHFYTTYFILNI